MEVTLESRRDVELYLKQEVGKLNMGEQMKQAVQALCLEAYDSGVRMVADRKIIVKVRQT